jgi:hypothetical protein
MASKNNIFYHIILLSLLCSNAFEANAKIILPELLTKQSVNNIRFLSQDGKFTYYQKRSGSLLFSTNYKVQEVIKGELGAEYNLFATPHRFKIAVLQNNNFQNFISMRAKQNIYLITYGETSYRKVGLGISPKLHVKDMWISYYDSYEKTIFFENTVNSVLKFSIKLNNKINPYFIPQVVMTDDDTIYYTDLNESGNPGLIKYKRSINKTEVLFKAPHPSIKFEICQLDSQLIFATFGIRSSQDGTSMSRISLSTDDFSKRENFYQSEQNDLGHLICNLDNSQVYFIKNYGNKTAPVFEAAAVDVGSKNITLLSELKYVTNLINMDGNLLTLDKGKYYIVKGLTDYKTIDSLKISPEKNKVEAPEAPMAPRLKGAPEDD